MHRVDVKIFMRTVLGGVMEKVKDYVSNDCDIIEEAKSPSCMFYYEFALIVRLAKSKLKFLTMAKPVESIFVIRDGEPRITNPKLLAKLKNPKRIVRENK